MDPLEWTNLAGKTEYAEQKAAMAQWLPTTNKEATSEGKDPAKRAKKRAKLLKAKQTGNQ